MSICTSTSCKLPSTAEGSLKRSPSPKEVVEDEPTDVLVTPEYVRTLQGPTEGWQRLL